MKRFIFCFLARISIHSFNIIDMQNEAQQQLAAIIRRKETRSQWWAVGLVLLCMVLGVATIYFGIEAEKSKDGLEESRESWRALAKENSDNLGKLEEQQQSSDNAKANYEAQIALLTKELEDIKNALKGGGDKRKRSKSLLIKSLKLKNQSLLFIYMPMANQDTNCSGRQARGCSKTIYL